MGEHIEREAVKEALASVTNDSTCPLHIAAAIDQILDAVPAADVAPVVHGYWIEVNRIEHDYETEIEEKCSVCGRHVYRYDTQPQDNHCPTCGADMGF